MTPVNSPEYEFKWGPSPSIFNRSPSSFPDFSPPLIAMVVVVATAFLIVTYFRLISRHLLPPIIHFSRQWRRRWRRWRHRRSHDSSSGDIESLPSNIDFDSTFHFLSPYGLDETVIKSIPLSIYTTKDNTNNNNKGFFDGSRDCAVCLLEFEENDYVRTLPVCAHAFHVDCIDIWLRSHANCPLCRAGIFRPESPFVPLMAGRIRPSLDDGFIASFIEPLSEAARISVHSPAPEIWPVLEEASPRRNESVEHINGRDFLLKRSYSFGFERNFTADRMQLEPTTASPWRYRRGSFWSKRPSPFSSSSKSRVFSFRSYRSMKSPFFRRRGFFPLSESSGVRFIGGGSSRRSKSLTSPYFMRSSGVAAFSSSRLRCGDPEALLSPERLNRR